MSKEKYVIYPCPFCGGEGELVKTAVFWVECNECGSTCGVSHRIRQKAVDAWNRRYNEPT